MNERIKELYNQSGGLVRMYEGKLTYFPAYQKNVGDGNFEFSSFDPEKFAELIVRECAGLCEHESNDDEYDQYDMGQSVKAESIKTAIKKHFGVEE